MFEIRKQYWGKQPISKFIIVVLGTSKFEGMKTVDFKSFVFFWAGTLRLLLLLKKSVLFFLNDGLGASHIDIVKSSTFVSTVNFVGWWDN